MYVRARTNIPNCPWKVRILPIDVLFSVISLKGPSFSFVTYGTGKYAASSSHTETGPLPGPPPPCGVENVLCKLNCITSTPISAGLTLPQMALKFAPSQ